MKFIRAHSKLSKPCVFTNLAKSCSTDPETGQMLVDVLCQWQDDPSEEPMMTLTVHDLYPVGCSGFDGAVVARLDYA